MFLIFITVGIYLKMSQIQNPVVVNLPQRNTQERIDKLFPRKIMMVLSIMQIVCGVLSEFLAVIFYFYYIRA